MSNTVVDLTGRVALVTGGGAGIGRGIALVLARSGADVVIADIDLQRADETAKAVRAAGRRALGVASDVMDTAQVRAAVESAADESFAGVEFCAQSAVAFAGSGLALESALPLASRGLLV